MRQGEAALPCRAGALVRLPAPLPTAVVGETRRAYGTTPAPGAEQRAVGAGTPADSEAIRAHGIDSSLAGAATAAEQPTQTVAVQRRAAPKGVPQVAPEESLGMSVEQLHVVHCSRLADAATSTPAHAGADRAPRPATRGGKPPTEVDWEWAALRACKLAATMRPADIASCAAAFARAGRRDVRLLFTLAEAALSKKTSFGAEAIAELLRAYATLGVRNEPLFEALGGRLADFVSEEGDSDGLHEQGQDADCGAAGATPRIALAVAHALIAHADLGFTELPAFRPLAAQLAADGVAARLPPHVSQELREAVERASGEQHAGAQGPNRM